MIEAVIMFLIYACAIAILAYIVIWVLGVIGVTIPPKIVQLLWVIVILIVILMAFRVLLPGIGLRFSGWLPMLA